MENLSSTLSLPVELLGLSDIEIEKVKIDKNNEIIIYVKSTKSPAPKHQTSLLHNFRQQLPKFN